MNNTASQFHESNTALLRGRMELIAIEEEIRLLEKQQEVLHNSFMAVVCDVLDPETSKPKFGNAEKRNAEVLIRETNSPEWTKLDEAISKLSRKAAEVRANNSYLDSDVKYALATAFNEDDIRAAVNRILLERASDVAGELALALVDKAQQLSASK